MEEDMNRLTLVMITILMTCGMFAAPSDLPAQAPPGMVLIPGGSYDMGCRFEPCYSWNLPIHTVYVDSFYMDIHEVTCRQYCDYLNQVYREGLVELNGGIIYKAGGIEPYCNTRAFDPASRIYRYRPLRARLWLDEVLEEPQREEKDDMTFQGQWHTFVFKVLAGKENHPMLEVSWFGAVAYANWLSEQDEKTPCYNLSTWECNFSADGYRLPTEAEWEYAARGGEYSPYYKFPWGDNELDGSKANYDNSGDPYDGTYPVPESTPVGYYDGYQSPPGLDMANGYGLYDMAGNVFEWCNGWWASDYYSYSPYDNPKGASSGEFRVIRGGSFHKTEDFLKCGYRNGGHPEDRPHDRGLRLVMAAWDK